MQICNANLEKLIAGITVKSDTQKKVIFMRLATKIGNPFQEWSEDEIGAATATIKEVKKISELYKKIISLKSALPADGCLDSYYQSVRTASTYIAADGTDETAEAELTKIYTIAAKRVLMMNQIEAFVNANEETLVTAKSKTLIARQKGALRAGIFDYFASEICNEEVKYDEAQIKIRISTLLANFLGNSQIRDYLISDTGSCTSISSDDSVAEKGDSEYGSAVSKGIFEQKLKRFVDDKECGEYVKQYFELDSEQRSLFAHIATSQFVSSVPDNSMSFIMVYGSKTANKESAVKIGQEYVEAQMITEAADYVRAERSVFHGKRPDVDKFRVILSAVKEKHKEMLRKNVDLDRLANSGAETRRILEKPPIKTIDSLQGFIQELRNASTGDTDENQALVNRLVTLNTYELQMMAIILSDRTAVDTRIGEDEPVNVKRFELIKHGLREDVVKTLGGVRAGGDLLNKALISLCSYRVKEDRIILGDITKDDLMDADRKTVIDYELLKKAFSILDENHPEGVLNASLRYSYDEVKTKAEIGQGSEIDSRIRTYKTATIAIDKPEILFKYIAKESPSEIAQDIEKLREEEKKLFMLLLANRGAVDASRRFEGKAVNQDMRDRITSEFTEHGTVLVDENTFKNALVGIFSLRMDDAKIAASLKMDAKDALEQTKRSKDIDLKLIEDALVAVKTMSTLRNAVMQNRVDSLF